MAKGVLTGSFFEAVRAAGRMWRFIGLYVQ
jgi:hypothetical protein